ncbi:hypothetical protein NA57DRAFT_50298 [Rhizodiscina lignyota]|uniref:Fungal N-terminal domain-containing protein n=1 Tax=Rhizodiscina lignyota TaxID=1504668 RepID=A0A9P4I5Z9_9PEZI|nr:hypothetical protein NA57DRAFT_50298 [Rhizodiscina lignyota]
MSVAFGSVGDIISVCLLAKQLVDTLDASRGSSAEFQNLIIELRSLERSLLETEAFFRAHKDDQKLAAIGEESSRVVAACQKSIETFSNRVKKYEAALKKDSSSNLVKGAVMKVRWQISEKESISKFRAEVTGHCNAIGMLLATANLTVSSNLLDSFEQVSEQASTEQQSTLQQLQRQSEQFNQFSASVSETLNNLVNRFGWFNQFGTIIKTLIQKSLFVNFATYRAVVTLQNSLPSRLERSLIQEPFILEDAIGRIAPVHLQFINSWDAFEAVIDARFKGIQGHRKVMDKEYTLQDHTSGIEVSRKRPWEGAFLPGGRIDMSFVFGDDLPAAAKESGASCPNCHTASDGATDLEIRW